MRGEGSERGGECEMRKKNGKESGNKDRRETGRAIMLDKEPYTKCLD